MSGTTLESSDPCKSLLVAAQERTALRPVVGSLAWIARAARPDISFRVNVLQTQVVTATVSTLHECNSVLDLAMRDANRGLTFKSGTLDWRKDLAICTSRMRPSPTNRV